MKSLVIPLPSSNQVSELLTHIFCRFFCVKWTVLLFVVLSQAFINTTCNNENIHIDSAIHLIVNQIRISMGRVKRVLLKKTKNLPSENFNCLQKSSETEKTRILPYYIWRKLWLVYNSPPNDLIWTFSWPFHPVVNLDCSRGFRPSLCTPCSYLCGIQSCHTSLP